MYVRRKIIKYGYHWGFTWIFQKSGPRLKRYNPGTGIDEGIVFSPLASWSADYNKKEARSPMVGHRRCLSLLLFQSTCLVRFAAWRSPPNSPSPPIR